MVAGVQFSAYQQIARMASNIDYMVQEALIARSQITNQLTTNTFSPIGNNVNILA